MRTGSASINPREYMIISGTDSVRTYLETVRYSVGKLLFSQTSYTSVIDREASDFSYK